MAEKKTAVFGIYSSRETAERGADAIVKAGFSPEDISVLLPENLGNRSIGTEKSTKAPEGATAGGGTGAVVGMGIPEYEAKRYEGRIQKGGILLSVHCSTSDEVKRAKEIIERTGGEDVSSTGEASVDKSTERTMRRGAGGVE